MNDQHFQLDYNHIADGIYIGTNQCCQVHFDERLLKRGITAGISLEEERIDATFGVEFYVWIPVKDRTAPSQEALEFGVAVLQKLIALGNKVYVHCKNGHGRAPTLVAAYLVAQGRGVEEAIGIIKKQRPPIHLEPTQKEALIMFAERITAR